MTTPDGKVKVSQRRLQLGGNQWQMGQVSRRPFAAENVYDLPTVSQWLPATVPGNVRTDLLALGRIPDPFSPEGWRRTLWVEDVDWWYRRQIHLDALPPSGRTFLLFEGIDYLSALFVDGLEVARHEGMFSRQCIEITDVLRADEPVEVAVRIWGSGALPRRRLNTVQKLWDKVGGALHGSWTGVYPDRSATLKCQMSFGWDFAPAIRTMGIWDEVWLVVVDGPLLIEELGVRSWEAGDRGRGAGSRGLDKSDPLPPFASPFQLQLSLSLDSLLSIPATASVTVTPANFEGDTLGPFRFPLHLPAGASTLTLRQHLPAVQRWQPWDRGFPHLYSVTVTLTAADGRPLDSITTRTGFRTVQKQGWQFSLDGQPEFLRGLNWVPADSFPGRLRRTDYQRLLEMARDSGANLLRVWGGGLREKRAFYDLCDELGLLVWQEFPFACMFLGSYPRDRTFLKLVEQECGAIVRRLRHHPSLLLWCGGNEFSQLRNQPLLKTLAAIVRRLDDARPFVPTSPSRAHGGDAHNWHVWHGDAPLRAYQQEQAHFLSEFGLQALPASINSMNDEQLVTSNLVARKADVEKLRRYANLFEKQLPLADDRLPKSRHKPETGLDASTHTTAAIRDSQLTIHTSQFAQAVGLQTAIEHMRRRKQQAGGLCLWQFNEPWPAVSWAIVDYFGRPKLAYQRLKTWYHPILISLEFPVGQRWQAGDLFQANIWLINDSLAAITNYELSIINDQNDAVLFTASGSLLANSAACVGRFSHRFTTAPRWLTATLRRGDAVLSENHYPLGWHDPSRGSLRHRFRRWVAGWVMR